MATQSSIENTENVKLPIPNATKHSLRTFLNKVYGNLIFRRVQRVVAKQEDMLPVKKFNIVGTSSGGLTVKNEIIDPKDYQPSFFTSDDFEKSLEFEYSKFALFTTQEKLRDNDKWGKQPIYCQSNRYRELDIISEYSFLPTVKVPKYVPPRVKDIVCMEVEMGPKGIPQAVWWFTCSEQFLHMWTMIMYDNHDSFNKKNCFTGNYLMTNTFLKWSLGHKDNGIPLDIEEANKRYYRLRTEYISRKWVHVYCAIVLLARYGELPTVHNIPNNTIGPIMTSWDLPENFVQMLLKKHTNYFDDIKGDFYSSKYFDLDGTIFERKAIEKSIQVDIDRPSIEGKEKETVSQSVPNVNDGNEFPPLLEMIKKYCEEVNSQSTSSSQNGQSSIKVEVTTSFKSWNNIDKFDWSDESSADDDSFYDMSPKKEEEKNPKEDSPKEKPQEKESPLEILENPPSPPKEVSKLEKIREILISKSIEKYESRKIDLQRDMDEKLEKMKIDLQRDMDEKLEKIKIDSQKDIDELLEKIGAEI